MRTSNTVGTLMRCMQQSSWKVQCLQGDDCMRLFTAPTHLTLDEQSGQLMGSILSSQPLLASHLALCICLTITVNIYHFHQGKVFQIAHRRMPSLPSCTLAH
mmetsp:Transcript_100807/g.170495  ORF Transcript_100807/g.170495 Transcript_100807/m.170495 type:complete len:102 (-) Transcript_100807:80-385(-)